MGWSPRPAGVGGQRPQSQVRGPRARQGGGGAVSDLPFPPAEPSLGPGLPAPEGHTHIPHWRPGPHLHYGHGWPGRPEPRKCRYGEPRAPTRYPPAPRSPLPSPGPLLWEAGSGSRQLPPGPEPEGPFAPLTPRPVPVCRTPSCPLRVFRKSWGPGLTSPDPAGASGAAPNLEEGDTDPWALPLASPGKVGL